MPPPSPCVQAVRPNAARYMRCAFVRVNRQPVRPVSAHRQPGRSSVHGLIKSAIASIANASILATPGDEHVERRSGGVRQAAGKRFLLGDGVVPQLPGSAAVAALVNSPAERGHVQYAGRCGVSRDPSGYMSALSAACLRWTSAAAVFAAKQPYVGEGDEATLEIEWVEVHALIRCHVRMVRPKSVP
jgi:hypothetical protein